MYSQDTVIEGIMCYMKREVLPTLPDYAKVLGGAAILHNSNRLSELLLSLSNTSALGTLGVITEGGNIDVDTWTREMKEALNQFCGGKLEIKLPFLNSMIFRASDIDTLSSYMRGELR